MGVAVFIFGFLAGAFLTRKSTWLVITGKAKYAVIPKDEVETKPMEAKR